LGSVAGKSRHRSCKSEHQHSKNEHAVLARQIYQNHLSSEMKKLKILHSLFTWVASSVGVNLDQKMGLGQAQLPNRSVCTCCQKVGELKPGDLIEVYAYSLITAKDTKKKESMRLMVC
jgi:hypothetical protein